MVILQHKIKRKPATAKTSSSTAGRVGPSNRHHSDIIVPSSAAEASPLTVESVLDPLAFYYLPSEQTFGDMSAYFTQHHFSPRWTSSKPSTPAAAPNPGEPSEAHHRTSLEALAHFLHAFNVHYSGTPKGKEGSHSVIHPPFDLVESPTAFVVYGELAGLEKKDVHVEVNDHLFTVTVSGQTTRPTLPAPQAPVESESSVGIVHRDSNVSSESKKAEQQPEETVATAPATEEKPEAKPHEGENAEPETKLSWHVTERRIGRFTRTFQFPIELVDMSSISASMQNGLLRVVVPKRAVPSSKAHSSRKVDVTDMAGNVMLLPYMSPW